jgi:hypothetical protein
VLLRTTKASSRLNQERLHEKSATKVAFSLAKLGRRYERYLPLLRPRL